MEKSDRYFVTSLYHRADDDWTYVRHSPNDGRLYIYGKRGKEIVRKHLEFEEYPLYEDVEVILLHYPYEITKDQFVTNRLERKF